MATLQMEEYVSNVSHGIDTFSITEPLGVCAGFGATGQRCMALSTYVFVGGSKPWENILVECAKAFIVNAGSEPDANLGPVISIQVCICGARLLLDGRSIVVPGYEYGNFIGPTILADMPSDMECYKVFSY
ncbi:methylmalonate-semialdehyde dehydrogenase [acylating], mitochondrial [Trifolium repens]|nr:methylmalonate-semialdehyde dehydrogenase [acylating], mitochondrial [Trifolium repens]